VYDLAELLFSREAATLVETLETYLDHAGHAQAAASAVSVRRSTLYAGLHRIEELTGSDLRAGDESPRAPSRPSALVDGSESAVRR
jgi:sugar diacid utilization regulator